MRRYELAGVLVLAAALRLLLLVFWSPGLVADAWDYDRLARSLVEGRGYTNAEGELSSWRPPLYPAFVAAGYILTGGSVQAVLIVQTVLDLGTVALTYLVGKWLFGRSQGLIAGLLVGVNLGTVATTAWLASETLFTFLLMAGVTTSVAWLRAMRDGRVRAAVALGMGVGALLGAATLARGVLLSYPLALIALAVVSLRVSGPPSVQAPTVSERGRTALAGCLALAVAFALTLTPWTARNYRVHGAFVPVATQLGAALYEAYNPRDGWKFGFMPEDEVTAAASRLPEQEANVFLMRAAVDSILASPVRTVRLEVLKVLYFWAPFDWDILPFYGVFNPTYAFIALWALSYVAFGFCRESVLATGAAWLPVLYFFAMGLVFEGIPRYRLPVEPLLAVFAAARLVSLDWRDRPRRSAAMVGGTVVFVFLLCAFAGPLKQFAKGWIMRAG
jgi:4-amino-4-deoxy-L-arabinose transferase-like glycosyltransferase